MILSRLANSFVFSFGILILTSCTSYQFASLSSNLPKSQYNDFFYENDSVQIVYSFEGSNCDLNIDIFNKLDIPIFINWNRSAFVINGKSHTLNPDYNGFYGSSLTSNYVINDDGTKTESFHPNQFEFVPPKSQISISKQSIISSNFLNTSTSESSKRIIVNDNESTPVYANEHTFSVQDTPIKFRSYITYTEAPQSKNSHSIESFFWISGVFKTHTSTGIQRPDRYHISKVSDFGSFMGGVAVVAILTVKIISEYGNEQ